MYAFIMFCRSLFVHLYFVFWSLCCLFFFNIHILITSLWYLQTLLILLKPRQLECTNFNDFAVYNVLTMFNRNMYSFCVSMLVNMFFPRLLLTLWVWIPLRRGAFGTILCDKVCQWLATGRHNWILLNVALKHHTPVTFSIEAILPISTITKN
jgi:hypothetical protein